MARDEDGRRAGEQVSDESGFPQFEHGQWTVEGQIERIGAFSRGAVRARGPRRWLAVLLVLLIVLPMAVGLISLLVG